MKLTVVIPCRNERAHIRSCVESVYACELPAGCDMRVFVVDGKSDDGTPAVIRDLQAEFPGLELVENTLQLTPYAFNLGIHAGGKADFVQILGARHILSPNYLKRSIEVMENDPRIWCVGGRVENVFLNEKGRIISKAMGSAFGMGLGNFRTLQSSGFTDTVGTPMYRYDVFEQIGFFDEVLIRNQDDDFNFRVTEAGGKIWYCHEISIQYYVRGNIRNLWRQFHQYGYWKVFVNRKHKAVTTLRQLVPPLFVLFLFAVPLSYLLHVYPGLVMTAFLALYLLLGLAVAFRTADKRSETFEVWSVFPVLHISYGLGYLKGILDFFILRKQPAEGAKKLSR
jgi:GT2 family glycosyltransferase